MRTKAFGAHVGTLTILDSALAEAVAEANLRAIRGCARCSSRDKLLGEARLFAGAFSTAMLHELLLAMTTMTIHLLSLLVTA